MACVLQRVGHSSASQLSMFTIVPVMYASILMQSFVSNLHFSEVDAAHTHAECKLTQEPHVPSIADMSNTSW